MFVSIAQITRLLYAARTKNLIWSYEIERLKGADGAILGKSFEDGCTIAIKIELSTLKQVLDAQVRACDNSTDGTAEVPLFDIQSHS